jgi:hypothetical protein
MAERLPRDVPGVLTEMRAMSVNELWLEILLTPSRDRLTVSEVCHQYGLWQETGLLNSQWTCNEN